MTIVAQQYEYVIGVDTHAKTHTLLALNSLGVRLGAGTFPTNAPGLARAHAWMLRTAPGPFLVAMEGTGSYGAQFSHLLTGAGIDVAETKPPKRGSRRAGKSDDIDAEHAARHVLSLPVERIITPRVHAGDLAALSVLLTARKAISKSRSAVINQLTALLRGHGLGIDARVPITTAQIKTIAKWRTRQSDDPGTATIRAEAAREAEEILHRESELTRNEKGLLKHVNVLGAWLLDEFGVGPFVAAQLLVSRSAKGRIRSEAAFARFAGVAPIPASSGNTTRHRLHRGGDRQLNRALWVVATTRYNQDPNTAAYITKRLAQGHTRNEIIRNLKRYLIRSLFRKMENHPA